jgi:hypothetical protein
MEDSVDALKGAADVVRAPHIADTKIDVRVEVRRARSRVAMDLRRQVVEDADAVAMTQELVGEVRSDKAGAARDQNASLRERVCHAAHHAGHIPSDRVFSQLHHDVDYRCGTHVQNVATLSDRPPMQPAKGSQQKGGKMSPAAGCPTVATWYGKMSRQFTSRRSILLWIF